MKPKTYWLGLKVATNQRPLRYGTHNLYDTISAVAVSNFECLEPNALGQVVRCLKAAGIPQPHHFTQLTVHFPFPPPPIPS
jgi:hypothetical protein